MINKRTILVALLIVAVIQLSYHVKEDYHTDEFPTVESTTTIQTTTVETTTELSTEIKIDLETHNQRKLKSQDEDTTEEKIHAEVVSYDTYSNESVLTPIGGVNYNADGYLETYYNLNMSGVISIMRKQGFNSDKYPYWIRNDGVKMLGKYVMVAADLNIHPRGSKVHTSLGEGLVCDTGEFTETNSYQFDIAVDW